MQIQVALNWFPFENNITCIPESFNFVATKPDSKKRAKKGEKEEFKMAPDGRMIITEGSDEEEPTKKGQLSNKV